jgi:hypothetical protein
MMGSNMETFSRSVTSLLLVSSRFLGVPTRRIEEAGVLDGVVAARIGMRSFRNVLPSFNHLLKLRMRMVSLVTVLVFATGFLGAIPIQANTVDGLTGLADQHAVKAFGEQSGNWSSFSVVLHNGTGSLFVFDVAEVNGTYEFSDEQKEAIAECIADNGTVRVMAVSKSYFEITGLIRDFFGVPIGVFLHMYLSAIDAINAEMAVTVLEGFCAAVAPIIVAALLPTAIGVVIAGIYMLAIFIICEDYKKVYGTDKNKDASFDITAELALFRAWLFCRTPYHLWVVTEVGAWIVPSENESDLPMVCWAGSGAGGRHLR